MGQQKKDEIKEVDFLARLIAGNNHAANVDGSTSAVFQTTEGRFIGRLQHALQKSL